VGRIVLYSFTRCGKGKRPPTLCCLLLDSLDFPPSLFLSLFSFLRSAILFDFLYFLSYFIFDIHSFVAGVRSRSLLPLDYLRQFTVPVAAGLVIDYT
jgi:hypothetical protein